MKKLYFATLIFLSFFLLNLTSLNAQTLAFPGADGFGRFAMGARGAATREVYVVTNLNDAGAGSFRDAVSKPGRVVTFAVGGIIRLVSDVVVSPNVYVAGQTAPGDGVVFFNKRVTFSSASNTIARYLRIRLGATGNSGKDASGLSNGSNMIFDHMSFTWAMDEVFSINWDNKGTAPDNITVQNSIVGQALHRENHSAGGLIQTPDGGKVSLLRNLYISNKTRNPKVKGVNEFVNNVVYNYGNANRLGDQMNYGWTGEGYIMGGSSGLSEVNIINNYFVGGPSTPPSEPSPFSRGTGSFNLYGSGNYWDNNKNGVLDGNLVPYNSSSIGYPGIADSGFKTQPYPYPAANPTMTAAQAYQHVIDNVGANYPRRDQLDALMVDEVASKGTKGVYVYRETDVPLANGGLGEVFSAPAPLDTDMDGMPDSWEDANGLNKNSKADAVLFNASYPEYLNIEVYVNGLTTIPPPVFIKAPTNVTLSATSTEVPPASTVIIKWVDNSPNETKFLLERSANATNYTSIAQPAANDTTYTDTGLTPNTTYYYRLKAANATDTSAYSAAVSITTPAIPSAPTKAITPTPANGFQFVDLTNGAVTLKWAGATNTTNYSVYFGTDSMNLVKQGDVAYVASPSYTVSGLADSTTYYWRIDASNNKGTANGNTWSFRTIKPAERGLIGQYSFDETAEAGNRITDSSMYQNDGVLGLDEDQNIRVQGKFKNALDFATAREDMYVVSVPNKDNLYIDKGNFSLSFWMKADISLLPTNSTTSSYLLCKGSFTKNAATGATGKRFNIEFKSSSFRFAIDDDATKDEISTSGAPFFTNQWVHVVVYRDTLINRIRVYRNGAMIVSQTSNDKSIGEASDLIIGNIGELEFLSANPSVSPAPYKGMLDELKIYNYALSDAEITALYNQGSTALPLTLVDFSVAKQNNNALINWKTSDEINTKDFTIEKSVDGSTWNIISTINAKGATNNAYAFVDEKPATGANYYRIKMNDRDGNFKYTPVKSVLFTDVNQLTIYPNPASSNTVLYFNNLATTSELIITDVTGKLVQRSMLKKNSNSYNLQTSAIPTGTYLIKLQSKEGSVTKKLVIAH